MLLLSFVRCLFILLGLFIALSTGLKGDTLVMVTVPVVFVAVLVSEFVENKLIAVFNKEA